MEIRDRMMFAGSSRDVSELDDRTDEILRADHVDGTWHITFANKPEKSYAYSEDRIAEYTWDRSYSMAGKTVVDLLGMGRKPLLNVVRLDVYKSTRADMEQQECYLLTCADGTEYSRQADEVEIVDRG